jgi:hypothetical protein
MESFVSVWWSDKVSCVALETEISVNSMEVVMSCTAPRDHEQVHAEIPGLNDGKQVSQLRNMC